MRAGDDVQGNGTYSGGEKRMRLTLTFSISVGERGGSGDGMGEDGEDGEEEVAVKRTRKTGRTLL